MRLICISQIIGFIDQPKPVGGFFGFLATRAVALHRNLGSRNYETPTHLLARGDPREIVVADFNGDERPDVTPYNVALNGDEALVVFAGNLARTDDFLGQLRRQAIISIEGKWRNEELLARIVETVCLRSWAPVPPTSPRSCPRMPVRHAGLSLTSANF